MKQRPPPAAVARRRGGRRPRPAPAAERRRSRRPATSLERRLARRRRRTRGSSARDRCRSAATSMCRGGAPGARIMSGHVHERVPHLEAVPRHAVLAELLAVVRGDDDRRARRPRLGRDEVEQLAEVLVGERDLAVVAIARALAPVDPVVVQVEVVRIEEVRPEEEAPRVVGRVAEHLFGELFVLRRRDVAVGVRVERDARHEAPVVEARRRSRRP